MIPLHDVQLLVKGVFGELSREAWSQNFMSDAVWNAAEARNDPLPTEPDALPPFIQWYGHTTQAKRLKGITNLKRYPLQEAEGMDDDPLRPRHVIAPTSRLVANDAQNDVSAWTQTEGDPDFLEVLANPFGNNKPALWHRDGRANQAWAYQSNWSIDENGCWFITFYRHERHKNQDADADVLFLAWESYEAGKYFRLEVTGHSARLIHVNFAGDEIDWEKSVSLSVEKSTLDNAPITIGFMPESRGVINIGVEGATGDTVLEFNTILEKRTFGNTIWPSTNLWIGSDGGMVIWQTGNHEFATASQLRGGNFLLGYDPVAAGMQMSLLADTSGAGASVAAQCVLMQAGGVDEASVYDTVINGTTDGTNPFWIYSFTAHVPAGERNGSDAVLFDSNNFADGLGNDPIIELQPQYEAGGRGDSWSLEMRVTADYVDSLPAVGAFKEHLCEIWIDGVRRLWNGIILRETRTDMMDLETMNEWTLIKLEIPGPWFLMDEDLMSDDPVGDSQKPGLHLKTVFANRGWKASEITGIPTTGTAAGLRTLPYAMGGEPPAQRPAKNVRRGDYAWDVAEKWGMGLHLMVDHVNGTWVLANRSTTPVASFSSDETPGLRRMIAPLDVTEEMTGVCSLFEVQGFKSIATKKRVGKVWRIYEYVRNPGSRGYMGRWVKFQPVQDDALRTEDDCLWVLRSLVREHGRPGRIVEFGTEEFYPDVQPDRTFLLDGVAYEVIRVGEASARDSKMKITMKEAVMVA